MAFGTFWGTAVSALLVIAAGVGVGIAMMGLNPPAPVGAKICFGILATVLLVNVFLWAISDPSTSWHPWIRTVLVMLLSGVVFATFVQSWLWVDRRTPTAPPSTAARMTIQTDLSCVAIPSAQGLKVVVTNHGPAGYFSAKLKPMIPVQGIPESVPWGLGDQSGQMDIAHEDSQTLFVAKWEHVSDGSGYSSSLPKYLRLQLCEFGAGNSVQAGHSEELVARDVRGYELRVHDDKDNAPYIATLQVDVSDTLEPHVTLTPS